MPIIATQRDMELMTWQVARISLPPPAPHAPATPVNSFAFDTSQELIWAGNEYVSQNPGVGVNIYDILLFKRPLRSAAAVADMERLLGEGHIISWGRAPSIYLLSRSRSA